MFKNKLINGRIKKSGKKRISTSSVDFYSSKSVGLIYTTSDIEKHQALKDFVKELESEGKTVDTLTYLPKGAQNYEFLFDYFTEKDTNFWGNFTNEKVNDFIAKKFDFLFCVDFTKHKLIRYILSQSHARCRVGFYEAEDDILFEFMLKSENKSYNTVLAEMLKYVKRLT